MKVFYAGDSEMQGPARYLLGILKSLKANVFHVPPGKKISIADCRKPADLYILSDYSRRDLSSKCEELITRHIFQGAGLLMVGGWGSFSGPFGGWKSSEIERMLPVKCLNRDDRLNFPAGALILPEKKHPILRGLSFRSPAAVCGINHVIVKPSAQVLLSAAPIDYVNHRVKLGTRRFPLLVLGNAKPHQRVAAFTSDFAPHWSAGFVDWGNRTQVIRVAHGVEIEVGNFYVQLLSQLISALAAR